MFLRGPGAGAAYFIEDFDVNQGLQEQCPPLAERARRGLQSKGLLSFALLASERTQNAEDVIAFINSSE